MITAASFSVLFFRTQKFQAGQPGIFALNIYTTKGIEKSKTKKKTVPGFGAISIDNFSF